MAGYWGILFGVIAGIVLAWMIVRVIQAGGGWRKQEFTGSEPPTSPDELEEHQARWDRSKEDPR